MCSTSMALMGLPHSAEVVDCFGSPTCIVLLFVSVRGPLLRFVAIALERLSSLLRSLEAIMDLLINDSEDETQASNSGADQVSSIRLYHGVSGWKFVLLHRLYRMVGLGTTMQAQVW